VALIALLQNNIDLALILIIMYTFYTYRAPDCHVRKKVEREISSNDNFYLYWRVLYFPIYGPFFNKAAINHPLTIKALFTD